MESEAESPRKGGHARKRTRKRPYTRKDSLSSTFINMAEARREIFNALQLHRSSSSVRNPTVPYSSNYGYRQQQQQLAADSMPAPEPTTAPAVEVLEVEWFDNVSAASHAWWMGFLSSLDRKKTGDESAESSGGLAPCLAVGKSGSDHGTDPNPFTDEWVVFPPVEECGGENV